MQSTMSNMSIYRPHEYISKKRPLPLFDQEGLRCGKWEHEEEVFADALIKHFENGTLSDCSDGDTLRAYVSKKLRCNPMRVSKKYAGLCIGKHVFTKATNSTITDDEVKALEKRYWESIYGNPYKAQCVEPIAPIKSNPSTPAYSTSEQVANALLTDKADLEDFVVLDENSSNDFGLDDIDFEWAVASFSDFDFVNDEVPVLNK